MQTTTDLKSSSHDCQAESSLLDGRFRNEHPPKPTTQLLLKVCWRLGVPKWVFELGYEGHSFLSRIRRLLHLRTVPINSLGPQYGVDATQHIVVCSRTRGRISDTRRFLQTGYRSPSDLEIFLTGWNAGARWCEGNAHFCTSDKETGLLACMEPPARTRE